MEMDKSTQLINSTLIITDRKASWTVQQRWNCTGKQGPHQMKTIQDITVIFVIVNMPQY